MIVACVRFIALFRLHLSRSFQEFRICCKIFVECSFISSFGVIWRWNVALLSYTFSYVLVARRDYPHVKSSYRCHTMG